MSKIMNKICGRGHRFSNAINVLGISNALKVFLSFSSKTRYINIFGNKFYYRGKIDRGVISHFYKEGYYIDDSESDKKIKTIVDGGGNIGDETMRFFIHYPNANIFVFEVESENFNMLQKNFNNYENIFLFNKGLYSKVCKLKIYRGSESNESFYVKEVNNESKFDIDAIDLYTFMKEQQLKEIDILKLDIEGAELELFTNNYENWIGKINCIIMEVSDLDNCILQKLFSILQANYNSYICGENIILIKQNIGWKFQKVIGFKK